MLETFIKIGQEEPCLAKIRPKYQALDLKT